MVPGDAIPLYIIMYAIVNYFLGGQRFSKHKNVLANAKGEGGGYYSGVYVNEIK